MTTPQLIRNLAVILHADVAGSTALVQRDENLAHLRITQAFQRFSHLIREYGGTVHEIRGDALVAGFTGATDAVCSALRFQQINAEQNAAYDDTIRPVVRIGIALGEEVFADRTVTGSGVILAQRVEQLATPGGICITGAVHEAIPHRMPFEQNSLGEQQLKGFAEPVRVYHVSLVAGAEVPPAETRVATRSRRSRHRIVAFLVALGVVGATLWWRPWSPGDGHSGAETVASDRPSIAVLPFTNMSGDPDQEYFADGITADLITDLSRVSGLMVIARNSSFLYKGRAVNVREMGRELGVRYVLEGSVQRAGQQVRINTQLIDARNGLDLWADRYDRDLTNLLELQDEVTRTIVQELQVQLTPAEQDILRRDRTVNVEAYDLLLRGNEYHHRFTREDNLRSREYYEQAAAIDPSYARAYANLALSYANEVEFDWTDDVEGAIEEALELSETALALDDTIPQIHFARSTLFLRHHEAAISAARRTIEVDPNYADGYGMLAHTLVYGGEHVAALDALEKAKRLNPSTSYIYRWIEARALFMQGANEKALALAREGVQRNPAFLEGRLLLAAILGHNGETDDAAWELEEARLLRLNASISIERAHGLYKRAEDRDRYLEGLMKAGLQQ